MNRAEIEEILRKHKLWLRSEEGGERADLRGADLRGANMSCADLRGADLRGANMSCADLRSANMRCADLRSADLRSADLYGADLRGADLRGADLYGADLRSANMSGADLGDNIILSAGGIGSRNDTTLYDATNDRVWCGCFTGTIADFKSKVAATYPDPDSIHRREYEAAIVYFETVAKARKEAQK